MKIASKIALGIGATIIGAGAALGVSNLAQAADTTSASGQAGQAAPGQSGGQGMPGASGNTGAQGGPGGQGAGRGAPAELTQKIATTFNLDSTKVSAALNKAFESARSTNAQPGDMTQMDAALAKSLASSLNVDESKLLTVLTDVRTSLEAQGGPQGGQAPSGTQAGTASGNNGSVGNTGGTGSAGAPSGQANG
ncbi:hypothetical protein [Nigerium sp.]|uniref:hypothetical protein n=1 Tax=Nigerium sp. TaxID=2042655 RepID=UPI003221E2D8